MTARANGVFALTTNGVFVSASKMAMRSTWKSLTITERGNTEMGNMVENGLPQLHPGLFLVEILEEFHVSQAQFARTIGVSPMRISHIVNGTRPVTAELALLFGRALGQSPQYWLNLQADYDLKLARAAMGERLQSIPELAAV